jgi:hypothetical protein
VVANQVSTPILDDDDVKRVAPWNRYRFVTDCVTVDETDMTAEEFEERMEAAKDIEITERVPAW